MPAPEAPYRYNIPKDIHGKPLSKASQHRRKRVPTSSDTIQKVTQSAFLAKVTVPFNNKDINSTYQQHINKGYWNNRDINPNGPNTAISSRFDLWVTEVNYGFNVSGPAAVSKYYRRHYTKTINLTPISVQGVCYDENEYDDLASFIREGQVAATTEPKNTFRLFVPAAKVDCLGVIGGFKGGFTSNNRGVPIAPQFTFDFVIFKDLKDNTQNFAQSATNVINSFEGSPGNLAAYKTYKNDYIVGQLMDATNSGPTVDRKEVTDKSNDKKKPKAKTVAQNVSDALGSIF
jgi:hypothetical protein